MEPQPLQHFFHPEHPLVFNQNERSGTDCCGCQEPVFGPSYSCVECDEYTVHHKSCAELPLWLHHFLHPIHPLILFPEWRDYKEDIAFSKCQICKESHDEYTYRCYRCDFNLHFRCAFIILTLAAEFHDHPLTLFWNWITFTCNLCGKEDKGTPYLCNPCGLSIHRKCAYFPRRLKVVRHKHPLHITHSSLDLDESDSRFCLLCVQKVDTRYGFYYCFKCDFVAHLNCAIDRTNMENINLLELKDGENEDVELDQSIQSEAAYRVKKIKVGEDEIEIATEIEHFSHEHDLMLNDEELHNIEKCDGCVRPIVPPFYSCAKCGFFLHKSCANLPKKKHHPLHRHPLTLLSKIPNRRQSRFLPKRPTRRQSFQCNACEQSFNGFAYRCENCWIKEFELDVQCSLILDIITHAGHKHKLILSHIGERQKCSCCDKERYHVFRCTICEFALDFKCATLPNTTRYKQHEHLFTLSYTAEDDSGEYYCDICEEERNPNHWFYFCGDCTYPTHPKCILGKYPNLKFGGAYTFDCHQHPLTFIEETEDAPPCHKCSCPCKELIYQCVPCNFYSHFDCA